MSKKVLEHVDESRRSFLKELILGSTFIAPVVASFAMSGISGAQAHQTFTGNMTTGGPQIFSGNMTTGGLQILTGNMTTGGPQIFTGNMTTGGPRIFTGNMTTGSDPYPRIFTGNMTTPGGQMHGEGASGYPYLNGRGRR